MDVDLICELSEAEIVPLIQSIGTDYYASETALRDAVRHKGCSNLIHLPTSFKVDVFVSRGRRYDVESMERATMQRLGGTRFVEVPIATAEDSIVSKLEWYRSTSETSERQWDDVSRLVQLLREDLDHGYLVRAAESVGIGDLLNRLLDDSK